MTCLQKEKNFQIYDSRLSGAQKQSLERHLAECRECREALQEWHAISGKFFKMTAAPSRDLVPAVMAAITGQEENNPGFITGLSRYLTLPRLVFTGALAAAMIFFVMDPFLVSHKTPDMETGVFVAELVTEQTSSDDIYGLVSEQLFGI